MEEMILKEIWRETVAEARQGDGHVLVVVAVRVVAELLPHAQAEVRGGCVAVNARPKAPGRSRS